MFETSELARPLSKSAYKRRLPKLRAALLDGQFKLQAAEFPIIIIVSGVDAAGKGEVVHRLNEWLDPRGVQTHSFWEPTELDELHPEYWRFWTRLPRRGRISILFGSWYTRPIVHRVYGKLKSKAFQRSLSQIRSFEEMLSADGALIVKLWFHLSKKAQRQRFSELEANPATRCRVQPSDWKNHKHYAAFRQVSQAAIEATNTPHTPWHIIGAADERQRDFSAGSILARAFQRRLKPRPPSRRAKTNATGPALIKPSATILDAIDLAQSLDSHAYKKELAAAQHQLTKLSWKAWRRQIPIVMVFEGWDAAGKGSAIRRVTAALDPRLFRVVPVAAPNESERAHPYLWRFWQHLPMPGRTTVFDRSWYGRVLVERVEGFAKPDEWLRAYSEITDFERQLTDHGILLFKFWIHISKDEQLKRFKLRSEIPYKRHKITDDDWRNRKKWDAYAAAVNDMVARTSTPNAPWTIIAGNDKKFARVQILQTIIGSPARPGLKSRCVA